MNVSRKWLAKNAPRHEAGARREAGRGAVFFHPDCDRRLRRSTGSADPPLHWRRSRARVGCRGQDLAYRRWGIAPRPKDVTNCGAGEPARHSNTRVPGTFATGNGTLRRAAPWRALQAGLGNWTEPARWKQRSGSRELAPLLCTGTVAACALWPDKGSRSLVAPRLRGASAANPAQARRYRSEAAEQTPPLQDRAD